MKLSAILEPLVAAGVDAKTILATVKAYESQQEDALEKRREADRQRQARKRESEAMSRDVTLRHSDRQPSRSRARVEDSSSKKDISGKKEEDSAAKPRGDLADFKAELSSILDPQRIEAIVAVRRKKGAVMTANTGQLLVKAIQRCPIPPNEVADEMALRNWTGIKPEWLEPKSQKSGQQQKHKTVADLFREEARRFENEPSQPAGYLDDSQSAANRERFGELIKFAVPGSR